MDAEHSEFRSNTLIGRLVRDETKPTTFASFVPHDASADTTQQLTLGAQELACVPYLTICPNYHPPC